MEIRDSSQPDKTNREEEVELNKSRSNIDEKSEEDRESEGAQSISSEMASSEK